MSTPINPFADLQTMMSQFSIPGVDLAAVVESHRKDIDALVAANQAAMETAQLLARKQTEMLTQAMTDIQSSMRTAPADMANPARQAAAAQAAVEKAIADMKELAEIAQASQKDVLAQLTARADEHMKAIRELVQSGGAAAKKTAPRKG